MFSKIVRSIPITNRGEDDTQELPAVEAVENALKPQVGNKVGLPAPFDNKRKLPRPNRGGERETEDCSK